MSVRMKWIRCPILGRGARYGDVGRFSGEFGQARRVTLAGSAVTSMKSQRLPGHRVRTLNNELMVAVPADRYDDEGRLV